MNCVEFSNWMRANLPTNTLSKACKRKVCGVGVNDADYIIGITVNGKQVRCPAYTAWSDMMFRCYGEKAKHKHPSYANVSVCAEWFSFMAFRSWWVDNAVDGFDIDKDVLCGVVKEYSPSKCVYISRETNSFMASDKSRERDLMPGVHYEKDRNKYSANINNPITGKKLKIGRYNTEIEAYNAWISKKCEFAHYIAKKQDDWRVALGVIQKYSTGDIIECQW